MLQSQGQVSIEKKGKTHRGKVCVEMGAKIAGMPSYATDHRKPPEAGERHGTDPS